MVGARHVVNCVRRIRSYTVVDVSSVMEVRTGRRLRPPPDGTNAARSVTVCQRHSSGCPSGARHGCKWVGGLVPATELALSEGLLVLSLSFPYYVYHRRFVLMWGSEIYLPPSVLAWRLEHPTVLQTAMPLRPRSPSFLLHMVSLLGP